MGEREGEKERGNKREREGEREKGIVRCMGTGVGEREEGIVRCIRWRQKK